MFACGNPSRGDDALGPTLLARLEDELESHCGLDDIELLTDFQLQIEHAIDLAGREKVLFVDASVAVEPPAKLEPVVAQRDTSYSTHAMTPPAVLEVYQQIYTEPLPDCFQLAIRGYEFELGANLTDRARQNLEESLRAALAWIDTSSPG